MLTLKSSDGQEFTVEESVILQSLTIKNMVEDDCAKDKIPLPNVDSKGLAKGTEYCNAHANPGSEEEDIKEFDKENARLRDNEEFGPIFDLLLAANYLKSGVCWTYVPRGLRTGQKKSNPKRSARSLVSRTILRLRKRRNFDYDLVDLVHRSNRAIDLLTMHAYEEEVHS
ncbi:hypothetical protein RJ639_021068 [Escallonia herrerae]|uniref:SKP1 component POZ domain-containing protein n=1 Tax=Escallonia herrerae TaxID=1293975 RepID=A0AA88V6Q2_9ASTE|nr:hypothetical protein RJ639_021068 [Escallonia herrerae]